MVVQRASSDLNRGFDRCRSVSGCRHPASDTRLFIAQLAATAMLHPVSTRTPLSHRFGGAQPTTVGETAASAAIHSDAFMTSRRQICGVRC